VRESPTSTSREKEGKRDTPSSLDDEPKKKKERGGRKKKPIIFAPSQESKKEAKVKFSPLGRRE